MKFAFLCIGILLGYAAHALMTNRADHVLSVELAEVQCAVFALATSDQDLDPSQIGCDLISHDDMLTTFQVIGAHELYVDCFPGVDFFRFIFSPEFCKLYQRD